MRRKRKDPPFENTVVEFSQKLAKGLGIPADMLNSPDTKTSIRDIFVQHMLKDILAEEDKMTVRVLDQILGSLGDLHMQMALLKDELERPRAFAPPFDLCQICPTRMPLKRQHSSSTGCWNPLREEQTSSGRQTPRLGRRIPSLGRPITASGTRPGG